MAKIFNDKGCVVGEVKKDSEDRFKEMFTANKRDKQEEKEVFNYIQKIKNRNSNYKNNINKNKKPL